MRFFVLCCALVLSPPALGAVTHEPFTPTGASELHVNIPGAAGFLFRPRQASGRAGQLWVWYAPTLLRGKPPLPNPSTHWLFTRLLAQGIWIGGVDVGESYGGPKGRTLYTEFYKAVTARYRLSRKPCFLAQSRGGLMVFGWAEENPGYVRCIAGIYPALNLASWPPVSSPLFREAASAYGYSSAAKFQKDLVQLSPISHIRPLAKARIPIFILHGDSDRIVPLRQNSQEFVAAYTSLGGPAELRVVPGKGHEEVNEFFKSEALLRFLLTHLGRPRNP